jgi:mannose-1-phosphate guanylyltransferase / mannose-6-phosphate isomerase
MAAAEANPEALVLLMPADHLISDPAAFRRAVATGAAAAADGHFVLFGIKPKSPATGYGYIESGGALAGYDGVNSVARFHEKPDSASAQTYLASGRHWWNSGIFLVAARVLLSEMEAFAPEVVRQPAWRWTGRCGIWTSAASTLGLLPQRRRSHSITR